MKKFNTVLSFFILLFSCQLLMSYPIDGFAKTGIKRLLYLQRVQEELIKGQLPPPGARLPEDSIRLNLADSLFLAFPPIDGSLQKEVDKMFPNLDESYSISLIDITNPSDIKYAERKGKRGFQPGSVGKLAVLTGIFCELENIYPYDFDKRVELLKTKQVRAGQWALPNIHTVPIFHPESNKLEKRLLIASDVFSLYEWLDHMVSVSSNGAASVVWREVILMRAFGEAYPSLTEEEAEQYFKNEPKKNLSSLAIDVVNEPLRALGIGEDEWRLGTLFTSGGSRMVPPQGGSIGSTSGLMKWLWALEHGQVIDRKSSLEMKKIMYSTDRRIRYSANPALSGAAVYFKSGSLYQCRPEEGYSCEKYKGNKSNYMNSVAIVEHPDGTRYMTVLMSNVLKKNSNIDHNTLGGRIDKLIRSRH